MKRNLTRTQAAMLEAIRSSIESNGYSPTIRELSHMLGYKACSTVYNIIEKIEKKGFITSVPGSSRSIRIVEQHDKHSELTALWRTYHDNGNVAAAIAVEEAAKIVGITLEKEK